MAFRQFFLLHKSDRQIVLFLLLLSVVALGGIVLLGDSETAEPVIATADTLVSKQLSPAPRPSPYYKVEEVRPERFLFDPNTADSTQLLRLGLQPWQVRNIYKYRAHGGVYRTPKDFARLYGLTQKQYRELEPYIRISADYQPAALLLDEQEDKPDTIRHSHKLAVGETIDLATADTTQLRLVPGIGSYFARQVVSYRERLGGYVSVNQLDEIEDFPAEAKAYFTLQSADVQRLNLNQLTLNQLKRHPYIDYYQARAIVEYRRLHGPIGSLDDLRLLRDFPQTALDRLAPYVTF